MLAVMNLILVKIVAVLHRHNKSHGMEVVVVELVFDAPAVVTGHMEGPLTKTNNAFYAIDNYK